MKIKRNGVEYELTDGELCCAYYEQQLKFDMDDVYQELSAFAQDSEENAAVQEHFQRALNDPYELEARARLYRTFRDRGYRVPEALGAMMNVWLRWDDKGEYAGPSVGLQYDIDSEDDVIDSDDTE
jgi:hypothetical protein